MSTAFQPKTDAVLERVLKTQSVSLAVKIVGNASAAAVAITADDPSILFINTAAVNQITAALATGETAPTYTLTDSSGTFGALVAVNESLAKVISARLVNRTANTVCYANVTATPTGGITAGTGGGSKIALQCTCATDFTGANTFDGTLVVEYQVR